MKFNFRLASRIIGMLLIIMAAAMTLPIAISIYYGDGSQFGLLLSAICILVSGLFLRNFIGAKPSNVLTERDGALFTALIWIVIPLFGALPYIFTSSVKSFTDAAFESFSGFTTTGSSVLNGLDNMPQGLLVWRSMSQWVGGMGLILFVIALLRRLNEGSAHLYESEFSGTLQRRLHPRMSLSVIRMWTIYIGMTTLLFTILMICGNSLVDSLSIAMSTVSTGGFMTHDAGLASMSANSMWSQSCRAIQVFHRPLAYVARRRGIVAILTSIHYFSYSRGIVFLHRRTASNRTSDPFLPFPCGIDNIFLWLLYRSP